MGSSPNLLFVANPPSIRSKHFLYCGCHAKWPGIHKFPKIGGTYSGGYWHIGKIRTTSIKKQDDKDDS